MQYADQYYVQYLWSPRVSKCSAMCAKNIHEGGWMQAVLVIMSVHVLLPSTSLCSYYYLPCH